MEGCEALPSDADLFKLICEDEDTSQQQQATVGEAEEDLFLLSKDQFEEVVSSLRGDNAVGGGGLNFGGSDAGDKSLWEEVIGEGVVVQGDNSGDDKFISESSPATSTEAAVAIDFDVDLFSPGKSSTTSNSSSSLLIPPPAASDSSSDAEPGSSNKSNRCPVCDRADAGKHTYYGARVCVSCRGFFRRSVQNSHYPLFKCQRAGNCPVDSTTRRSCKSCRFQKCLTAGMKISWVMSDQERRERIARRNNNSSIRLPDNATIKQKKKRSLSSSDSDSSSSTSGSTALLLKNDGFHHRLTEEERGQLMVMFQDFLQHSYLKYYSAMARKPDLFRRFALTMVSAIPVERKFLEECEDIDLKAVVEYGFDLPEVRSLPAFDRMTVMYENHKLVYGLMCVAFYDVEDIKEYFNSFISFGRDRRATDPTVDSMVSEMERLSIGLDVQDINLQSAVDEMWNVGLDGQDEKREEARRCIQAISPLMRGYNGDARRLDPILMVLLLKMLLLRDPGLPHRPLEDAARVRALHEAQAWQLHRYLKTVYGREANGRLHKLFMLEGPLMKFFEVCKLSG